MEHFIHKRNKDECLNCNNKTIEKNKFFKKFPCGCGICTKECFEKYIKPKKNNKSKEKENGKFFEHIIYCSGGKIHKKKDIKKIINWEMDNNNDNEIDDRIYREIVENHWIWNCNLCLKNESFNRRFRYYRLILKQTNPFTNEQLEHLICFKCRHEIKNEQKQIYCQFCEEEHLITSIKNVNEDNEIVSSCQII